MQFVGVADERLRFGYDLADRFGIEAAQILKAFDREGSARGDRSRAALGHFAPVEERIRVRVEEFVTERRRLARVAGEELDLAPLDLAQHSDEGFHVVSLVQAIVHRLTDERMIGQLDVADHVLLTAGQFRKDRRQQVLTAEPLQGRGHLLSVLGSDDLQGARHIPAPAVLKNRHGQDRLLEHLLHVARRQHSEHAFQRKTVLRTERQHDAVIVRVRLQLEVERPAEPLPHGESPRPSDPRPKRSVNHQLHPAALIEEAFEDDSPHRRQQPDGRLLRAGILDRLPRGVRADVSFHCQPIFDGECDEGRGLRGKGRNGNGYNLV